MSKLNSGCELPLQTPEERFRKWYYVLGDPANDWIQLEDDIQNVTLDLFNQLIIRCDSKRTRADHPLFRKEAVDLLERILTYYLQTQSFSYKHGLTEVLAHFFLFHLEVEWGLAKTYLCFSQFREKFLADLLRQDGLPVLQGLFCAFKFLVWYHLPALGARLEDLGIAPELYTMPWLVTLFAAENDIKDFVYPLWDFVILQSGKPLWFVFAGLALLEANLDCIKMVDNSVFLERLHGLKIPVSHCEVNSLWVKNLEFLYETPSSSNKLMDSIKECRSPINSGNLAKDNVLFVDPFELYKYSYTFIS